MYFIVRTPNTAPLAPNLPKIVEIALRASDHVEGKPEFMGASARWCYWVVSLPAKKSAVQTLLFGVSAECASNPGLYTCTARQVNKALCEWLELRDERT